MDQSLFGAFAIHSPESCAINNLENKKIFLEIKDKLEKNKSKYGVKMIECFYMSVLEHEWMIIFEAESAHDIESLCIDAGIASFNTVKIVALKKYEDVQNKIQKQRH
ncbi:MAG: hypothetical protein WCB31_10705 [Nitrososphaeraceae archaeon]